VVVATKGDVRPSNIESTPRSWKQSRGLLRSDPSHTTSTRSDRGSGERNSTGGFGERNSIGGFGERNSTRGFGERNSTGGLGERNSTGGFGERNSTGGSEERNSTRGFRERNSTRGFGEGNSTGGFERDLSRATHTTFSRVTYTLLNSNNDEFMYYCELLF